MNRGEKRDQRKKEEEKRVKKRGKRGRLTFSKKHHYETHPLVLTKSFTHPRIVTLVQPLAEKKIDSRAKLMQEWEKDKKFLYAGVLSWIKERYRQYLLPMWPPIDELKVPVNLLQENEQLKK